jgi:hypothetical protein
MSLVTRRRETSFDGVRGRTGEELLRLAVRRGGLSLGRSVELLLDLDGRRALGLDVDCGDDTRRFLPFLAAEVRDRELAVDSALPLLDEAERRFYLERGTGLAAARGLLVERHGRPLGALRDVVLGADGTIAGLLVAGAEPELVPFDASVSLRNRRRRAPAA